MSTNYKIIFNNQTGSRGEYAIFSEPPTISSAKQVYTNAWITQTVNSGGNFTVSTSLDFYAWVGTTPVRLAPHVTISGGTSQLAQLGKVGSPGTAFQMVVEDSQPDLSTPTMLSKPGAFEIDTGHDFPSPNSTYLIGLGKVDSNGIVSPVATAAAVPNMHTNITPIMKFYIGQFSYEPGEIVDFNSVSGDCGVIDFSSGPGLGRTTAVVTQDEYGNFSTIYTSSKATRDVLQAVKYNRLQSYLDGKSSGAANTAVEILKLEGLLNDLLSTLKTTNANVIGSDFDFSFQGLVNWPAATSIGLLTSGLTLIVAYLIRNNYGVEHTTTTNPDGSHTAKLSIKRQGASALLGSFDPQQDWLNALAADTLPDGHTNGGFKAT
jgi:hypothetical protein